jgi:hypothetical protein
MKHFSAILLVAYLSLLPLSPLRADAPAGFFLTWNDDPCTTMVVDWHVGDGAPVPELQYRKKGADKWMADKGAERKFPFAKRRVLRAELGGLEPDATYEFRFGSDGDILQFRTMPKTLARPVRFAIGGDTMHRPEWLEKTNLAALGHDPDFAVLGGDLSYENGEAAGVQKVIDWFDAYRKTMVTPGGRVVPVVVTIGNHEVRGGFVNSVVAKYLRDSGRTGDAFRSELAPYFYALFACPGQPGYRALDFGDYLSLVLLDSNHTNPIEGEQSAWLAKTLSERAGRPHVFPVYHVPGYPSVRPFEEPVNALVREHWIPLFEKSGVRLAFENHDHAFKRTKPILAGKIDPAGITFLGDGSWGVEPRSPHADSWYLEKSAAVRSFMIVTLDGPKRTVGVFDEDNKPLDAVPSADAGESPEN